MVIRSRLPREGNKGIGSKIMNGAGKLGKLWWDSIPAGPSYEKKKEINPQSKS